MLKNYFTTAWRNLIRGKSFSIINISGLAIGMAGAILILLWLQNEISFDKFHVNKDRLYEAYILATADKKSTAYNMTSMPLGPAQNYTYHINIGWGIFLVAGVLAILIALITVSFQSIKAAVANPVKNLRTE